jgi:membrane-bound metal-dependent hydrolase YbcI (DUF457 family)
MANYKGHVGGGVIAYALLLYIVYTASTSWPMAAEWLFFCLCGSLFPDIDIKSKARDLFYWFVSFAIFIMVIRNNLIGCAILSVFLIIPLLVKHRGIFHSLWFIALLSFGSATIISMQFSQYRIAIWYDALFFFVGAFSHLWLDFGIKKLIRH